MNLAEARQTLADALSELAGVTVRAHPSRAVPRPGDGWVTVSRIVPDDFTACTASLAAVVVLSADEAAAEASMDDLGVALVDAVTGSDLSSTEVALDAQIVVIGQTSTPLYVAVLTVSVLVDPTDES